MNKLLILIIVISFSTLSSAQKGSWYVGGMAGYTSTTASSSGNDFKSSTWNFSPELGSWLSDGLQLGLAINLSGTKDDNDKESTSINPTMYIRKWKSVGDKFSIYGGFNASYTNQKFSDSNPNSNAETKYSGYGAFLDFGASLAVSERWRVIGRYAVLGYSYTKLQDNDVSFSQFGLDVNTLGNPFNIGVYYTFKQ